MTAYRYNLKTIIILLKKHGTSYYFLKLIFKNFCNSNIVIQVVAILITAISLTVIEIAV